MLELWNNIMNFMKDTAFTVANFPILWWYVIVAAVALVVILLIVTISVAVSKKKKKKKAKEQQATETGRIVKERQDDAEALNEVSPDWQDDLKAKHRKKQKKHGKQESAPIVAQEEESNIPEAANEAVADVAPIAEETIVDEPTEDIIPAEEPIVEQAPVKEIVEPVKVVTPVVKQEEVAAESNKPAYELAEKVQPAPTMMETYQPQRFYTQAPAQQPIATAPIEEPKQEEIVEEPIIEETFVEEEVAPADIVQEEPVVEETTPIVEEKVVIEEVPQQKQEVAATSAPRALPKKKTKTTKKTASEIADDIEKKTGTNPRRKSSATDKPDVVGKDKLPKRSTKAKKEEEITKAANTAKNNDSDELPLITTDPNVETFGKFIIIKNDDNSARPYHFRLLANNGQILFESESYKSKPKSNSIVAFKKAAANEANFETDVDKAGNWRYKLYNAQHAVIGVGESYSSKQGCENSVQSVIKFAESARLLEDQSE